MQTTVTARASLLEKERHYIDVRAPIEFESGSLPLAINLPILMNEERHLVGITYAEKGQAAAIRLGHELVSGNEKLRRIEGWVHFFSKHPESQVYCFRGGLRSQIAAEWMAEAGAKIVRVEGGYKALRRELIQFTEAIPSRLQWTVVAGPTGSNKTKYLRNQNGPYLDLEGLANHRGSVFGGRESPQPNQVSFENALAFELIKLQKVKENILIENESRLIGKCTLPKAIMEVLQKAPKLFLKVPFEERVNNILEEYIIQSPIGQNGDATHFLFFVQAVEAITRKLGQGLAREIKADILECQQAFIKNRELSGNRKWIAKLLSEYYDKRYQLL